MLKLRRVLSLGLAPTLLMTCVLLASCGGDEEEAPTSYTVRTTRPSFGSDDIVLVAPGGHLVVDGTLFEVAPFYIAKRETTHAQYDDFMRADGGFDNAVWWTDVPPEHAPPQRPFDRPQTGPRLSAPRESVLWYQAVAYTRWLNVRMQAEHADISEGGLLVNGVPWEVRLPTEWEWQWAAQGGAEARDYPWGEWRERLANTVEDNVGRTREVGSYPGGSAAFGALDMSGNVSEWCLNKRRSPHSTAVDGTNAVRAVRGGSDREPREYASSSFRSAHFPRRGRGDIGFRVGVFPPR